MTKKVTKDYSEELNDDEELYTKAKTTFEGDKLKGVRITHKNDDAIKKTIGKRIALLSIVAAILLSIYVFENTSLLENHEKTLNILDKVSSYTVLDEAIDNYGEQYGYNLARRIDYFEELVDISEELHFYKLSSIVGDLESLEVPEVVDLEGIKIKMKAFDELLDSGVNEKTLSKDSERFVRLVLELEADEKAVNYSIQNQAFSELANLKLLVLKSKVADECEFGPEAINNMSLLEINGERTLYYYGSTGNTYKIGFDYGSLDLLTSCNLVPEFMDSIFDDQTYSIEATTQYNHAINERLKDEATKTRTMMMMDCHINNDGNLVLDAPVAFQRLSHSFRKTKENDKN